MRPSSAIIGTIFFATLSSHGDAAGHPGYVAGFERSLEAGLAVTVVMALLTFLLPRTARDPEEAQV